MKTRPSKTFLNYLPDMGKILNVKNTFRCKIYDDNLLDMVKNLHRKNEFAVYEQMEPSHFHTALDFIVDHA